MVAVLATLPLPVFTLTYRAWVVKPVIAELLLYGLAIVKSWYVPGPVKLLSVVFATTALEMLPSELVVTEIITFEIFPIGLFKVILRTITPPEPTVALAFVRPPLNNGSLIPVTVAFPVVLRGVA